MLNLLRIRILLVDIFRGLSLPFMFLFKKSIYILAFREERVRVRRTIYNLRERKGEYGKNGTIKEDIEGLSPNDIEIGQNEGDQ